MKNIFFLFLLMQVPVSMQGQFLKIEELDALCLSETDKVTYLTFENELLDYVLESHELEKKTDTLSFWRKQGQIYSCINKILRTNYLAQRENVRNSVYRILDYNYREYLKLFIQLSHHPAFQPHYAEEFLDYLLMYHNYNLRSALKQRDDLQRTDSVATPLFYSSQEIRRKLNQDEIAVQFCFNKNSSIMGCYIFVISPDYPLPLFLEMDGKESIWLNLYVHNFDESMTIAEWIKELSQDKGLGGYLHDRFPEVVTIQP